MQTLYLSIFQGKAGDGIFNNHIYNYTIFAILQRNSFEGFLIYIYMSVIQTIRDKYARWAVIAIALALTGFILMDAFTGRSRLFGGGNTTTLGRVNGKTIDENEFEKRVQAREQNEEQQKGTSLGEADRQQIIDEQWKQDVDQLVLKEEFDKLGFTVGKKEFADLLYAEPNQVVKQYFGNPQTGEYDPNNTQQIISSIKRGKDKTQKEQLNLVLDAIENSRLSEKYLSLVAGTIHYPKWFFEKQNAENSLMAKISYVKIPASTVPDNAKEVAVSDKEIADFISKHKDLFELEDEIRTIEYVLFSAAPSASDSAASLKQIESLKDKFAATNDSAELKRFLANESDFPYADMYFPKSAIQVPVKDSIFSLAKNTVYGPYLDKSDYALAKMVDSKTLPDSVYCRHILMRTSGDGALPDSIAEKRLDSAIAAINNGASFVAVMKQVSMDQAANSQDSTGLMKFSSQQIQDERFDQDFGKFILFEGTRGQRKKVKTKFGYHYIEIVDQKNIEPHYKVAYLAKKIEASDETERNAENSALQFAGESRDVKSFDADFEKNLKSKGLQKLFAPDISSHAYEIPGVGVSRRFIKHVFEADRGDVLQPERVGDNFVVAAVTEVNKPGTISVAMGRRYIEPVLRNQKKAGVLKKKIGNITTLDAVSAAMKQPVQMADSIRFSPERNGGPISYESRVVGAAFNPANKGKVVNEALEGRQGDVYVIRVDDVSATVLENADVNAQRRSLEAQNRMAILMSSQFAAYGRSYDPALVLRKAAKIKDNRNKFY